MTKDHILELLHAAGAFAAGLVPGALGAAVSVMTQTGLTWAQRFVQFTVGIVVAHYAGQLTGAFTDSDLIADAVGFVAGLSAYNAVKQLRDGIAEVARTAPKDIWENIKGWFGRRSA